MSLTDDQIQAARTRITDRSDGPLTDFVMISRALEGAANDAEISTDAWAEALATELEERGYLDPKAGREEVPGS